jgi:serine/threonine protein kinase
MVTANWLEEILAAVGAAHKAGVIHRDLKPDNIFITQGEKGQKVAKVLDFGLAKIKQLEGSDSASPTAVPLTTPGAVMGTFGYMAPEQLMGGVVNERSDLFSVGVITVEMLTGQRPFQGKTYHEQLAAIINLPFAFESERVEAAALNEALQSHSRKKRTIALLRQERCKKRSFQRFVYTRKQWKCKHKVAMTRPRSSTISETPREGHAITMRVTIIPRQVLST